MLMRQQNTAQWFIISQGLISQVQKAFRLANILSSLHGEINSRNTVHSNLEFQQAYVFAYSILDWPTQHFVVDIDLHTEVKMPGTSNPFLELMQNRGWLFASASSIIVEQFTTCRLLSLAYHDGLFSATETFYCSSWASVSLFGFVKHFSFTS